MRKIRIAVLFGGISGEHEVSCMSAVSILSNLDQQRYAVTSIGITKTGRWFLQPAWGGQPLTVAADPEAEVAVWPGRGLAVRGQLLPLDVIFPILHGIQGEDGKLQGLLECAGLPYAGAKVLSSALGMDKAVAKKLWEREGLPVVPWLVFTAADWGGSAAYNSAVKTLGLPLFVKPANSGSSVGVAKVTSEAKFVTAFAAALAVDSKVLVEKAVDAREIEVAVIGKTSPKAYGPGEVVPHHEFYDYEAKYTDPDGADLEIPAHLPVATTARILDLAVKAYKALDTEGFARVDFFVDKTSGGEVWLNEINTLPGFTTISMFPRMAVAGGLPYPRVLDAIIDQALDGVSRS